MNMNKHQLENLNREELKRQIEQNKGWYFITFVDDLPRDRPYGFTIYKASFILLKHKSGQLSCYMLSIDEKELGNASLTSFKAVEKQGGIWFWYLKNSKPDWNLIPTIKE